MPANPTGPPITKEQAQTSVNIMMWPPADVPGPSSKVRCCSCDACLSMSGHVYHSLQVQPRCCDAHDSYLVFPWHQVRSDAPHQQEPSLFVCPSMSISRHFVPPKPQPSPKPQPAPKPGQQSNTSFASHGSFTAGQYMVCLSIHICSCRLLTKAHTRSKERLAAHCYGGKAL